MKKKILIGGLGLVILTLIYLCYINSYYNYHCYMAILSLKFALAVPILTIVYIKFLRMIKNDRDMVQELDYRKSAPNVARLKWINKRLGKS